MTISTACSFGLIFVAGWTNELADGDGCGTGPANARDALEEVDPRCSCGEVSSEDAAGAGDHTIGRIGEVGIHDSKSG